MLDEEAALELFSLLEALLDELLDEEERLDSCSDELLLNTELEISLFGSDLDDSSFLLLPPNSHPVTAPRTNEPRSSVLIMFFIFVSFLLE